MPVRLRITLLFSALAFVILSLVCGGIYYFSYKARLDVIKSRLKNRAITTARLLSQREIFNRELVARIDSSTTISLKEKAVEAYNENDILLYRYSDQSGDDLHINSQRLRSAREKGEIFFTVGEREAVGHHYRDKAVDILVFVAGEDVEGKANLNSLAKILLYSFLIGNIFVLISGYVFSARLLLPIKKITNDVEDISAQNLTRRIETGPTKDEWNQLAATLNNLLNRLQASFDMQRHFISNASHELSTPLTAISSQLEVALQRERNAAEYKKVIQSTYQDVQQLCRLTQTLLEFAKASGNKGGLEISPVRIDEIVLQLPAEVSRINSEYSVQISFNDLPENEDDLVVFGSEALLLSALKNIVVNACKYSENNRAEIELGLAENQIIVSVSDRGTGIKQEEIEKIFQPFYRINENSKARGFGLGLALAQQIIKMHKGFITVNSTVGRGTVFVITFSSGTRIGQS